MLVLDFSDPADAEFPDPRGWKKMRPDQKRRVLRSCITLSWIRKRYRGSKLTPAGIYKRMVSDLETLAISRPSRRFAQPSLNEMMRQLLKSTQERLTREHNRISCIYELSKHGVHGFYIGRTVDLSARMNNHSSYRPVNKGLVASIRDKEWFVNADGLRVEVIEWLDSTDIGHMRSREQYYIVKLRPLWNRRTEIADAAGVNLAVTD